MAYPLFHQLHQDFKHESSEIKPDFYDTDGSPVYEGPYGELIGHIVSRNDVAALRLYHLSPQTRVFWGGYEIPSWHPLFVAQKHDSFDALRLLLEIYLTDSAYTEPLDEYLKRLRFSPINVACAAAQKELTLWLLDKALPTATLDDRDSFGRTPLFSAANGLRRAYSNGDEKLSEHEDFICFLLDQGCSVPDSNIYVERSAEETENVSFPSKLKHTVLGAAISHASYKMVSRLIAEGADVHDGESWSEYSTYGRPDRPHNSKGLTALHIASLFWNVEGIQALMDHCGDKTLAEMCSIEDNNGLIPLHWALLGAIYEPKIFQDQSSYKSAPPRMEAAKLLLAIDPDMINARDKQGATVFNYAVRSDTALSSILSTVQMLLDAKPLASTLKAYGLVNTTALEDAARHHFRRGGKARDPVFAELINTLLENDANTHLCLHGLCDSGWHDSISPVMIDRMLESSDINETDTAGCTALHYLVRHMNQMEAVRHLIRQGANVNVINHKGNTPLHEVMGGTMYRWIDEHGMPAPSQPRDDIYRVREELVEILVEAGGSMDQVNEIGKTPTQLLDELTKRRQR